MEKLVEAKLYDLEYENRKLRSRLVKVEDNLWAMWLATGVSYFVGIAYVLAKAAL